MPLCLGFASSPFSVRNAQTLVFRGKEKKKVCIAFQYSCQGVLSVCLPPSLPVPLLPNFVFGCLIPHHCVKHKLLRQ